MPSETGKISVSVPLEKQEALEAIASSLDRTRSWVVNDAIDYYLEMHKWQLQRIKDRMARSKNKEAKHASHEDVTKWLSSWGSDKEQETPKCE